MKPRYILIGRYWVFNIFPILVKMNYFYTLGFSRLLMWMLAFSFSAVWILCSLLGIFYFVLTPYPTSPYTFVWIIPVYRLAPRKHYILAKQSNFRVDSIHTFLLLKISFSSTLTNLKLPTSSLLGPS